MEGGYSIEKINNNIDYLSRFGEPKDAYNYYLQVKKFVDENISADEDVVLLKSYNGLLARLKFMFLNNISDWADIINLIKNYFVEIFEIKQYDLWVFLKTNLSVIPNMEERAQIKEKLRNALSECQNLIIDRSKYKDTPSMPASVSEWIKDYGTNIGFKNFDSLSKAQYLTNSHFTRMLKSDDKNKLNILLDIYDALKKPSNTPEGFEMEVPMKVNNKFVIFNQGQAEEVGEDLFNLIRSIKINNFPNNQDRYVELKSMAAKFPPGSLERRAVEEELKKLEVKS